MSGGYEMYEGIESTIDDLLQLWRMVYYEIERE